jgi:hypothetical protein
MLSSCHEPNTTERHHHMTATRQPARVIRTTGLHGEGQSYNEDEFLIMNVTDPHGRTLVFHVPAVGEGNPGTHVVRDHGQHIGAQTVATIYEGPGCRPWTAWEIAARVALGYTWDALDETPEIDLHMWAAGIGYEVSVRRSNSVTGKRTRPQVATWVGGGPSGGYMSHLGTWDAAGWREATMRTVLDIANDLRTEMGG